MKSIIFLGILALASGQDYHLQDDYYDHYGHYDDSNYLEPDYFAQREYESHASPVKVDKPQEHQLPSYCDPPNPCPLGYNAKDGCLEDFENTSDFSRRYQASQQCQCDKEHMSDCNGNNDGTDDILASVDIANQIREPFLNAHIAAKKGFV